MWLRKVDSHLTIDSSKWTESAEVAKFNLARLFDAFPNAKSLTLGTGAWLEAETCFGAGDSEVNCETRGLREITAHLFVKDIEIAVSFIFFVLEKCTNLTDMTLLIHREVESSIASNLMPRCIAHCARVKCRWGFWKEGMKDACASDGI